MKVEKREALKKAAKMTNEEPKGSEAEKQEERQKIRKDRMEARNSKENSKVAKLLKKYAGDPLFREFMEVHAGGDKNIWDNDLIEKETEEKQEKKKDKRKETNQKNLDSADEDSGHKSDNMDEVPEEGNKVAEEKISDLEVGQYLKQISFTAAFYGPF